MNKISPLTAPQHLRYKIKSSFEEAANLAKAISADFAAARSCNPDVAASMRLCLAEALNNIVDHAYDARIGMPIQVDVSHDDAGYQIRLIDRGRAMPNGCVPDPDLDFELDAEDLETLPEGGFGLVLLQIEMDRVDYERRDRENILTLTKYLD